MDERDQIRYVQQDFEMTVTDYLYAIKAMNNIEVMKEAIAGLIDKIYTHKVTKLAKSFK